MPHPKDRDRDMSDDIFDFVDDEEGEPKSPFADLDLTALEDVAQNCRKCALGESRTKLVFGEGSPTADLMFIGEGPGYYEDQQGRPFCRPGRGSADKDDQCHAICP